MTGRHTKSRQSVVAAMVIPIRFGPQEGKDFRNA
jgi:hypothetical protein